MQKERDNTEGGGGPLNQIKASYGPQGIITLKNERQQILQETRAACLWENGPNSCPLCRIFRNCKRLLMRQLIRKEQTSAELDWNAALWRCFFTNYDDDNRRENLNRPPSKHSTNKHCQRENKKKKKNTDRFILCYISILHIFILTCSERSHSVGLRCIFMRDGSIRAGLIARNFKFYSLQLEVSHLWLHYIVTFNIYYSLKCIAWSQAVTFAVLSTVLLRGKKRSRP